MQIARYTVSCMTFLIEEVYLGPPLSYSLGEIVITQ